jgi:ribosome-binding factor A
MKHRLERVRELMKRELGDLILRELTFEAQLVTVQEVDITPDLKHAHVYVSVIGDPEQTRAAMAKLHEHRNELQYQLSRRVILKYTPQLHFKLDESIERGSRIIDIMLELEQNQPASADEEENEQQ